MSTHFTHAARYSAALLAFSFFLHPLTATAHAITGNRVFPATLAVDDPGVSDEMNLPQVSWFKDPEEGWTTETSANISKRLTENFGLSVGGTWIDTAPTSGWDNFSLGAKYLFLQNAPHEFMASAGLDWDIGGTGAKHVGAESFSTVTPALFIGKGMGDLPDSMKMWKPFAVTGAAGIAFPSAAHDAEGESHARTLEWGGTLQYSLPYLQQHIKDIGIASLFSTAIPLIELAMETPLNGGNQRSTGTINPGVIFMGQDFQLGLEAIVPINSASGSVVGGMLQIHIYLDDLFPKTMGGLLW